MSGVWIGLSIGLTFGTAIGYLLCSLMAWPAVKASKAAAHEWKKAADGWKAVATGRQP